MLIAKKSNCTDIALCSRTLDLIWQLRDWAPLHLLTLTFSRLQAVEVAKDGFARSLAKKLCCFNRTFCVTTSMELLHLTYLLFALTAFFPKCAESLGTWSYHGEENPDTWKYHYRDCGGRNQSPVAIVPKDTIFDAGLADLTINYEPNVSAFLQNNGHSVQATFLTGTSNISGGGLPSRFQAVQLHFHWGSENSRGSEHQVNGRKYPMEIHIVHYNAEKYPNVSTAMTMADGLAVLGILVELQASDNPVLNVIVEKLEKIPYKYDNVTLDSLQPYSFLPFDIAQFYTYKGSLTTPGCFESVRWFVFNHTFGISEAQLEKFRSSTFDRKRQDTKKSHLSDNFRPVQPLNGRTVTRSFSKYD